MKVIYYYLDTLVEIASPMPQHWSGPRQFAAPKPFQNKTRMPRASAPYGNHALEICVGHRCGFAGASR